MSHNTGSDENRGMAGQQSAWESEYDYRNRLVTVTRAAGNPRHWDAIGKDAILSDPEGLFDIYVTRSMTSRPTKEPEVVKVVARLDDDGDLHQARESRDVSVAAVSVAIAPAARERNPAEREMETR